MYIISNREARQKSAAPYMINILYTMLASKDRKATYTRLVLNVLLMFSKHLYHLLTTLTRNPVGSAVDRWDDSS